MRKNILILFFLVLSVQGLSQISVENVDHDMDPLEAAHTHEVDIDVSNSKEVPQALSFTLKLATDLNHSNKDSIFDVSGSFESGASTEVECDFSYQNAWTYSCPGEEEILVDGNSDGNLTLKVDTPLNIRGGSNIIELNSSVESRTGELDEQKNVEGEEFDESIGNFNFIVNGNDLEGKIATAESFVFEEASSNELLGRFRTNISNHDSITVEYSYFDSFVENRDFEFNLYKYEDGDWQEVDTDLIEENNTVEGEISGNSYYSFYVDRRRLSIEELIERDNNVTRMLNDSGIFVEVDNLGQYENITVPTPSMEAKGGISFSGFEFMSNVNNTGKFNARVLEELPNGRDEVSVDGYRPVGYAEVEANPEESLEFSSFTFEVNSSMFDRRENVDSYRYNGSSWVNMDTEFVAESGNYSGFRALTDGNSLLSFGTHNSSIGIDKVEHEESILDNESLDVEVTLRNSLKGLGEKEVDFVISNESKELRTVEVSGETTKTVNFSKGSFEAGNYSLRVNNKTSRFSVELRPLQYRIVDSIPVINSVSLLYAVIIGLISIPLIVLFYTYIFKTVPNVLPSINISWEDLKRELITKKICSSCMRVYEGEECSKCENNGSLKNDGGEEDEGDFKCAVCGETFDTATGLTLHHKKFHEDIEGSD